MNTTFFDLLWQLKQELELKGLETIDMPAFIEDLEYRRRVLKQVDLKALNPAYQQILPELLDRRTLDITRQVRTLPPVTKPRPGGPVHTVESGRKAPGFLTGLFIVLFLLVGVAALVELTGNQIASDLISTAGLKGRQADVDVASPAVASAVQTSPTQAIKPHASTETLFRIHGSNTIGETLAPELLKAFWQQQGAQDIRIHQGTVEVERDILFSLPGKSALQRVELKAHGSSTGFKGLLNRETDLAMASRRIKDQEKTRLAPLYGDLSSVRTEHVVGMDGLAIIVHPRNPISSLSTAQLARLFSGEIVNWKQLGGPDEPVRIYSRDENSGTWDSFKSMVLKKHGVKLAATARRFESSMELSDRVSQEPGAIGFIGLPYVLRAKALAVADEEGALPVFPTTFTVSTEDYPLTRRLYMYEPMTLSLNSPAHQFMRFVTSEEGQDIVRKSGFISQNIQRIQPVLSNELPQEYLALTRGGSRLSLNFRFNSGTFELDNKAQRDLERVIRFFEKNPGQRVFLIGFSDSTGDPEHNRSLSLQRAQIVRDQLLARGINVADVQGLGALAPVASNATATGRERNRRVEVWVRDTTAVNATLVR
ncbi:substrate-binding domain-containing protein [Marinobacterium sediminicola]|uniref:Phosphate ABC transporter substrate-binding protein, PhoT family n=1 Tax=Marinobacterium sediminicola TaxID=518898 RepID=A0ABY1S0T0_9GAMM|nr:phosphate ABC transporter substrate-binding/OmpA family protein [Marinobacterium sediminicola]ULG69648.1 phosphate ABC transporter substrate-binding/OmpA family protein [Marinobacterium sediminicola]SMR74624.1 phosphate ABC transporter substrate-binding protein, PhoT family [Marinobacterium sediminicola]